MPQDVARHTPKVPERPAWVDLRPRRRCAAEVAEGGAGHARSSVGRAKGVERRARDREAPIRVAGERLDGAAGDVDAPVAAVAGEVEIAVLDRRSGRRSPDCRSGWDSRPHPRPDVLERPSAVRAHAAVGIAVASIVAVFLVTAPVAAPHDVTAEGSEGDAHEKRKANRVTTKHGGLLTATSSPARNADTRQRRMLAITETPGGPAGQGSLVTPPRPLAAMAVQGCAHDCEGPWTLQARHHTPATSGSSSRQRSRRRAF